MTAYGGHIAIDDGNVYWDSPSQILSCPVAGNCGTGAVVYTGPEQRRNVCRHQLCPHRPRCSDGVRLYASVNIDDNPTATGPSTSKCR